MLPMINGDKVYASNNQPEQVLMAKNMAVRWEVITGFDKSVR
jgi:hypothetical protein